MRLTHFTLITGQKMETFSANPDPDRKWKTIEYGISELDRIGKHMQKLSVLISFIKQYPEVEIETAIRSHLSKNEVETIYKTKKGKGKYQYWIPMLYIYTEEYPPSYSTEEKG